MMKRAMVAPALVVAAAHATSDEKPYKSGSIESAEKFKYGKFVTRMKAPNKKGTVAAFFTYWDGPGFQPQKWNEIDIEVVPSVSANPLSLNVIYGDGKVRHESHSYARSFDPKDEWHLYELKWTPTYISYMIDNQEVRRVEGEDPAVKFSAEPQSVVMNFWSPMFEAWGAGLDPSDMPWQLKFDFLETYTYEPDCEGFEFKWRDDFVTLDTKRWQVADNTTFEGNSSVFRAGQVVIEDGHLVLTMEQDTVPEWAHSNPHPHFEPTQSEPPCKHTGPKGEEAQQGDAHPHVPIREKGLRASLHDPSWYESVDTEQTGLDFSRLELTHPSPITRKPSIPTKSQWRFKEPFKSEKEAGFDSSRRRLPNIPGTSYLQ